MGKKLVRLFHRLIPAVILVTLLLAMTPWGAIPQAIAAGDWYVNPGDSIQAAIDAADAAGGGTVNVAAGTYYELITLKNDVVVQGEGASVTTINGDTDSDGSGDGSVVTALNLDSTAALEGFTITNGEGSRNRPDDEDGGGMYNNNSSPTVTDCTFSGNWGDGGGGMYNNNSSPSLTSCTFVGNSSGEIGGGGMYNQNSSPTLTNCTFSGNWGDTVGGSGGGMYNQGSSPTLINCTFAGNHCQMGGSGGGMYNSGGSSPILTNCTFSGNEGHSSGGGMSNSDSSPALVNCTFSGNAGYKGGGMYNNNSSPSLTSCTFSGNASWDDNYSGGGMCNRNGSSPTLTSCTFTGNTGAWGGGGMYNHEGSSPTLINCTFAENEAGVLMSGKNDQGGGMNNSNSSPILINCTFSGNHCYVDSGVGYGGIFSSGSSSPTLVNCIMWGDEDAEIGGSANVSYSDIDMKDSLAGPYVGTGNINADPLLTSDLHLQVGSPCVDVGNNSAPLLPAIDFDGDYRILDGDDDGPATVDMGADEAQGASLTPPAPTNVSPSGGATGVSLTPTLQASAFSDGGDTHAASQWQVRTAAGSYSSPVFNSVTTAPHLTSTTLSPGILNGNTAYYWHVRYTCTHGSWSEWSVETSFTTVNRPPSQPSNISPANGASGMSLTPTLESSSFSDPDSGDIHTASQWQIRTSSGSYSAPVLDRVGVVGNLTAYPVTELDGLGYSTTYYWHVRYQDNHGGWSDWSAETSFTTATRPPYQPSNVSPVNASTEVSLAPTLQSSAFSDPDGGDSHAASQWQVTSTSGDYSTSAFDSGRNTSNLVTVVVPSGRLNYLTTYYWHVRYQDDHGNWSDWSVETSFTTLNRPPNQPTNISPANGATGVSLTPTIQCSSFSDMDSGDTHTASQWQVRTAAGSYSSPAFDSDTDAVHLTNIDVATLSYSTTHYWHVRHLDAHGGWSEWSVETSFTTATRPPYQPNNVLPASGATEVSLTPTLQSSAFSDPDSGDTHAASQWQVASASGDYSSPVFDSLTDTVNLTSIIVPSAKLDYSNTYYWRVCHRDSQGNWSVWSPETSFTTIDRPPNQPTNVSPANGETGTSLVPTLQASVFSDPDLGDSHSQSQWQITTTPGEYSTPVWGIANSTDLTSCAVPSGTLNYSTTYYWHVRYQDQHGVWSAYSSETSFITSTRPPSQPSTYSPANGATEVSLTPTLQSSAFSDPDSGDIHAASQWQITVSSGSYASTVFDSSVDSEHLTQIDIASGILGYSNLYYWRVKYQDNRGTWSEWSAEASFTTLNREPNQPVNAVPSNGASGLSRSPMLQSSSFSDPDLGDTHMASQWQVTSVAGDYSTPVFDSSADAGHLTSIAIPSGALQYSTSYHWHVRHQDNHGFWSAWSAETSFGTASQPQAEFSIVSVKVSGEAMLVFFSNLSSGGVSSLTYAWDFDNDGTIDATEREPWHHYDAAGTYTVSLTIRDAVGDTDTEVKPNCLTILSPTGGKMETADGQVSTEFPAGAVVGVSVVTIESTAASTLPESPIGFLLGNTSFVIMALDKDGNEIVTLSQPSTITVEYSEEDLAAAGGDPHRLVLAYWDEAAGEWKPLKTSVDTANMTLSASTTHLSTWAVLAKTASASNGLPLWSWVLIVLGAVGVVGASGYLAFTRLAKRQQ